MREPHRRKPDGQRPARFRVRNRLRGDHDPRRQHELRFQGRAHQGFRGTDGNQGQVVRDGQFQRSPRSFRHPVRCQGHVLRRDHDLGGLVRRVRAGRVAPGDRQGNRPLRPDPARAGRGLLERQDLRAPQVRERPVDVLEQGPLQAGGARPRGRSRELGFLRVRGQGSHHRRALRLHLRHGQPRGCLPELPQGTAAGGRGTLRRPVESAAQLRGRRRGAHQNGRTPPPPQGHGSGFAADHQRF